MSLYDERFFVVIVVCFSSLTCGLLDIDFMFP